MDKKLKKRGEISPSDQWDIASMYPDESLWEKDVADAQELAADFEEYRGKLTESGESLLAALRLRDRIWQTLERAYVYARMRRDEDNSAEKYQAMTDRVTTVLAKVSTALSFFTPEIIAAPEERILGFLDKTPGLDLYRFVLKTLLREKAHVLNPDEENLLAQFGEITPAPSDIFTMLNNADLKFGTIRGEDGEGPDLEAIRSGDSTFRSVRKVTARSGDIAVRAISELIEDLGRDPLDTPYWDLKCWEAFHRETGLTFEDLERTDRETLEVLGSGR